MNHFFKQEKSLSIFEMWKELHHKVQIIYKNNLLGKKKIASELQFKHDQIFQSLEKNDHNAFVFDPKIFNSLIKYLVDSNQFFQYRLTEENLNEFLIIAFFYEWVCLGKKKDHTVLGDMQTTFEKILSLSQKNKSITLSFFKDINLFINLDNINIIKTKTYELVYFLYEELIEFIKNDLDTFKKISKEEYVEKDYVNEANAWYLFNKAFSISRNDLEYSYSNADSNFEYIHIIVKHNSQKVGHIKFKIHPVYNLINGKMKHVSYSKELIILAVSNKFSNYYFEILENIYQLANKILQNFYQLNLELLNDQKKLANSNLNPKKIVKIVRRSSYQKQADHAKH